MFFFVCHHHIPSLTHPSKTKKNKSTYIMWRKKYVKILLDRSTGGKFDLSDKAKELYKEESTEVKIDWDNLVRHDPLLISVYEKLGKEKFNGKESNIVSVYLDSKQLNSYKIERGEDGFEILNKNGTI